MRRSEAKNTSADKSVANNWGTKKPRAHSWRRGWVCRSVLVGEHDRETGAASLVGVADGLQGVQTLPAGAGDDDAEEAPTLPDLHGRDSRHPEDVMPDAAPVVRVLRIRDRLLDEGEDRRRHGDMNAGEVLGGDLGEVAGRGVGKDAVGDGLGAGVNADDGETVERVAGLVDLVAGLRCRITGDVTHGMSEECAPTRALMGVAGRATRSPQMAKPKNRPPPRDADGKHRLRKVERSGTGRGTA